MATTEIRTGTSAPPVLTEAPKKVEALDGRHLEVFFAKSAAYHRSRVLEPIGAPDQLPKLEQGSGPEEFTASETRLRKLLDIMHRDDPIDIPSVSGGINREYIVALADNLAWKGVENSLVSAHLDVIKRTLPRLRNQKAGRVATGRENGSKHIGFSEVKHRERSLKPVVIGNNHFYRNFFDSGLAADFDLDSPAAMKRFLKRASLTGSGEDSIVNLSRGVALEIAAKRFMSSMLAYSEKLAGIESSVDFGYEEEDRQGGDIVVRRGDSTLYIDIKNMCPDEGISAEDRDKGFKLTERPGISKAVVWSESSVPVAEESFRLTDPSMKFAIQNLLLVTS